MKYAAIKKLQASELKLSRLFTLFNVSSSGYYSRLKRQPSKRELNRLALEKKITTIYWQHQGRYGYRRIYKELLECHGYQGARDRIRRLMKRLGLKAIVKRRFKVTTHSKDSLPVYPNLLNQQFYRSKPNQAWVGDITYIRIAQNKWLYLATVLDLCTRKVIGWAMDKRMTKALACDALSMALYRQNNPKGVIVHTDRGSQYCSKEYQGLIKQAQLTGSMSGKGNCYDNAVAESFFHTLKSEHVYGFYYETHEEAKRSIFWYIESYYNRIRRHSGINYMSPNDFEKMALKNA